MSRKNPFLGLGLDSPFLSFSRPSAGGGSSHVTDSLVAYVDAANTDSYSGSGSTWSDLSGNGLDMTLSGTPGSQVSSNPKYINFDGVDDHGIFDSGMQTTFNGTTKSISYELWINVLDSDAAFRNIFGPRVLNASDDAAFYLLLQSDGDLEIRVNTSTNTNYDLIYDSFSLNVWQQVVATLDRSDGKTRLYINNSLVATYSGTAISGSYVSFRPFILALASNNSYRTNMRASKVLVYEKALSASEIQTNWNHFRGEFGLS